MFSDPQTITVNAVAKVLPRVLVEGRKAVYQLADQTYTLTISHQPTKERTRSLYRVDLRAVVADPLTSANDYEDASFQIVLDRPLAGFSLVTLQQLWTGIKTHMDDALIAKLFGQES